MPIVLARLSRPLALCALLFMMGGCVTMTSVRSHPEFASQARSVRTVALVPPDVQFTTLNFTGEDQRDFDLEASLRRSLADTAENALVSAGYSVRRNLVDALSGGDKNLGFEYEQLREAYERASQDLYAKSMNTDEAMNCRANVGTSLNVLAAAANADALLLIRHRGFNKSGGLMANDIIAASLFAVLTGVVAVPARQGNVVEAALLDGVTGDVLWTNVARLPYGGASALQAALSALPPGPSKESVPPSADAKPAADPPPAEKPPAASK